MYYMFILVLLLWGSKERFSYLLQLHLSSQIFCSTLWIDCESDFTSFFYCMLDSYILTGYTCTGIVGFNLSDELSDVSKRYQ